MTPAVAQVSTRETSLPLDVQPDVRVETVPEPKILNSRDALVKITLTAICGSDLHLYHGYIPSMEAGDILGHEFMGEIVETGPDVKNRKVGDRVVVTRAAGTPRTRRAAR